MIVYEPKHWLILLFSFRGTVITRVADRIVLFLLVTLVMWGVHQWLGLPAINPLGHTLLGVAVGLLIVFRNNSSYDRYWEGRKLWGAIVNASRNLVRGAAAYVGEAKDLARLVSAYALALKQHLRSNTDLSEIQSLVPPDVYERAAAAANPPSIIAYYLSAWVHDHLAKGKIDSIMARSLESSVSAMLDNQGGCERILKTPIPFAYAVHIKQLLMLYLLTLPLVLVPMMDWSAILAVGVIAFGLLGIEEAGVEIEDPFGDDPNDLPVENICAVIARDTQALAEMPKR
jgi:putative membrane protein